ncbi:MAG: acyl-CoA thioesterase [Paludibacteraceae bacterium]|nr:acyl-CoA thioesterase [Paludibacteraceae bacterium]
MQHQFFIKDIVRDYECDLQGIVNNAIYMHYTEHARHEFLRVNGISFSKLHDEGCDAVLAKAEVQYKSSLRSQDEYISCVSVAKDGLRYVFSHYIYRSRDKVLCVKAKMEVVCVVNGTLAQGYPIIDEFINKINNAPLIEI